MPADWLPINLQAHSCYGQIHGKSSGFPWFWLLIDKLKVYGTQFEKKLGLATFGSGWGGRVVTTFGRSLLSGFTSSHKKLPLISGGYYFRGWLLLELYGIALCDWTFDNVYIKSHNTYLSSKSWIIQMHDFHSNWLLIRMESILFE